MRRSVIGVIIAGLSALAPVYAQTVTVTPATVSVHLGTFYQFSAKVTGTTPTTVMAIAPGLFETPMLTGMPIEVQESLGKMVPFPPRLGRPDEFASVVVFLVAFHGTLHSLRFVARDAAGNDSKPISYPHSRP